MKPDPTTMTEEVKLRLDNASSDQILRLNEWQTAGQFHPFTCPNRGDGKHRIFNGDLGALVATRAGWICPWCDYTQSWAHGFMASAPPPSPAPIEPTEAIVALQGMLDEWDKFTRYGSEMAKSANERVAFARKTLAALKAAHIDAEGNKR
jgi:hypothetical protein